MFKRTIISMLIGLAVAGCASSSKSDLSQGEKSRKEWNEARANVLYGLAKQQYTAGNYDVCRKSLEDGLKLDQQSLYLHLLSAKLSIEQGQLEAAERELKLCRDLDAKNAEACYLSGVIYQRWQKPQSAFECYSLALDLQPAELPYLMAKAEMLVAMDQPREALTLLQARLDYYENSAVIRDAVGQLLIRQGKFGPAADVLRQASILTPDDQTIREHLALAMYYAGQYTDAVQLLTRMTQEERFIKRADLFIALGQCQLQLHRPRDARDSFESAAQLDASSPIVWLDLAKAAMELKDLPRAELSLRKATSLEPGSFEARLMLGYLRLRQGKLQDAMTAFREASTLDHNDTVSLCMVGYVFEKLGDSAQAIAWYAKALKVSPADDMASRLMSQVQIEP